MQKVVIYTTLNVSAETEVNAMLTKMAPRWRLKSIQVTTVPWKDKLYHTTVVVLEET